MSKELKPLLVIIAIMVVAIVGSTWAILASDSRPEVYSQCAGHQTRAFITDTGSISTQYDPSCK